MVSFKKEHFKSEHPDQTFPQVDAVSSADAEFLRRKWCSRLHIQQNTDPVTLLRTIDARAEPISASAEADDFSLIQTLESSGLNPTDTVYINWGRFETVDVIRLEDLSRLFEHIWYPAADDIEVFDATCAWILLVRHDGALRLLRLPS